MIMMIMIMMMMMTLTSCVGGEDFTCDDGTCVRINKVQV